ncbi:hypothetical protein GGR52DRAFT_576700 [Hypoxylon sp. FL1284]|nr:hypothetical protein GGR52DRAFT_576700 [Hypoxylon sp. FL1284]
MRVLTLFLATSTLGLAVANPLLQPNVDKASPLPSMPTASSPSSQKTEMSICCCCLSDPQPEVDHYTATCPRNGVQAVCNNGYAEDSEYSFGGSERGMEGNPDMIEARCSLVRCGPVLFED